MDQVLIQYLDRKNVPGQEINDEISYIEFAELFPEQKREIIDASYVQVLQHMIIFQFRVAETAAEELQNFLDRHNQDGTYGQDYFDYWRTKQLMDIELQEQEDALANQDRIQRKLTRRVKRCFMEGASPIRSDMDIMADQVCNTIRRDTISSFR